MAQTTRTRARVCLFGVWLILLPILGVKSLQNPNFWGVNKRFQAERAKILKVSYYRNYIIDFNQILHNDRDHQVVIVGCPNTHPTNPRWRTAAILEKNVISPYLCNCLTDFDEIWHGDAHWPLSAHRPLKFRMFENSRWRAAAASNGLTCLYEIWSEAARRLAANAGSVMLAADVRSWTQTLSACTPWVKKNETPNSWP